MKEIKSWVLEDSAGEPSKAELNEEGEIFFHGSDLYVKIEDIIELGEALKELNRIKETKENK